MYLKPSFEVRSLTQGLQASQEHLLQVPFHLELTTINDLAALHGTPKLGRGLFQFGGLQT